METQAYERMLQQQLAYQQVLLEVSSRVMGADSEAISTIICDSFLELGGYLHASRIMVQIYSEAVDGFDEVCGWTLSGEALESVPMTLELMVFFETGNYHVKKGALQLAFGSDLFSQDALIYPLLVDHQPIGYMRFDLMVPTLIHDWQPMIQQTVGIISKAYGVRSANRMCAEHMNLVLKTLHALPLGVIVTDAYAQVTFCSEWLHNYLGCCEMSLVGLRLDEIVTLQMMNGERNIAGWIHNRIIEEDLGAVQEPLCLKCGNQCISIYVSLIGRYTIENGYEGAIITIEPIKGSLEAYQRQD